MSHDNLVPGIHCLCYHPQHAWVPGVVDSFDGKHGTVTTTSSVKEQISKLLLDDIFICDEEFMEEDVNDLLNLSILHDGTILNCLRKRYFRDVVYTNIGAIVVALNPFNFKIPWYMDDKMSDYLAEGETIERNLPHSWAVAHLTYNEMQRDKVNQSILVSGESGAGKTEASKIVMKYLDALSARQCGESENNVGSFVGQRMFQSNPILEAFGNAKTVRNDNSSRFGKLMRIKFDRKGALVGADITKYLLEKSRIITSAINERVYHAFYLLLKGRDRERLGLRPLPNYRSVVVGKAPDIEGVDDAFEYDEVNKAMGICGISVEDTDSVWRCVGAVLSLLNLDFVATSADSSEIDPATAHYLTDACKMLCISEENLRKELYTTTLNLREGPVITTLTKTKAIDARDSFCKALYDGLFGHLVNAINKTIDIEDYSAWIALLDIFGFEDFKVNSFEQLCINLTNETLQRHYNYFIFTRDMDECRAEGIDVAEILFPDNTPCVDMISGKGSILAVLDEDCLLAKATDISFLDKISDRFAGKTPFFERPRLSKVPCFRVVHYAGTVTYEVEGFIEKNRDTLKDAFKLIANASSDSLIQKLLPMPDPDNKSRYTVGGVFRNQLKALMDLINSTNPHWIRCIKPHPAKKPLYFDGMQTLTQLRSSGVLGTVQIRKAGFPIRIMIHDFARNYKVIVRSEALDFTDAKAVAVSVLRAVGFDYRKAQIGKTRVFLKSDAYQLLEVAKKKKLEVFSRIAVCGALVSMARFRTAAFLRTRSVETIQSFLAERRSQIVHRQKDFNSRKEMIIANAIQLLKLVQREEAVRLALVDERESFVSALRTKIHGLIEELYNEWLSAKPARDAAAQAALLSGESTARAALHDEAQATLSAAWTAFAAERAALKSAAALKAREALRLRAAALWDEQKRRAEAAVARRAEALSRGRAEGARVAGARQEALELFRQEPRLQARARANYPAAQFHAGPSPGGTAQRNNTVVRQARAGRIVPDRHSSLDTVRRLRVLLALRDVSLGGSGKGKGEGEDPMNPHSARWVPPGDGLVALPDGTALRIDDAEGLSRIIVDDVDQNGCFSTYGINGY